MEEEVRRLAADGAGAERIRLDSWTDDPAAVFQQARAVVTASNSEGLSNVLVEAAACGAPLLTTDVSGAREVLDPSGECPDRIPAGEVYRGRGGFIVPVGDGGALLEGMRRLASDDALGAACSEEARGRALEAFSPQVCVGYFLAAIESIIAGSHR